MCKKRAAGYPTGADRPRLKIAIATYGHTAAIKDGSIPIEGVDANFVEVMPIIGAFRRMVRDLEFDVCEMAPTTYMIARALGAPYIALPIFVMRRFHHGGFVVRPDAGIKAPKDLEGKKVGVRAYSVTTGVWTRGIFTNEYGLDFVQGDLGGGRRGARHHAQAAAERRPRAGGQVAAKHDGDAARSRRVSPVRPASAAPARRSATGT